MIECLPREISPDLSGDFTGDGKMEWWKIGMLELSACVNKETDIDHDTTFQHSQFNSECLIDKKRRYKLEVL
jgi:hypothetical protein